MKLMKNQRRFKTPNCRGGCVSRKCQEHAAACSRKHSGSQPQISGSALPARHGGQVRFQHAKANDEMLTSANIGLRFKDSQSAIGIPKFIGPLF
jgi:hypothetical protein